MYVDCRLYDVDFRVLFCLLNHDRRFTQLNFPTFSTSLATELLDGVASLADSRFQLFSSSHDLKQMGTGAM